MGISLFNKSLFSTAAFIPVVQSNFAADLGDYTTLSTLSSMPSGGSVSRAGQAMRYDSTGKLTYAPANMFLQSQAINNAPWGKYTNASTVTADTTTAPDGTVTADSLTEDTTTNSHNVFQSVSLTAGVRYAISFYAKPNGRPRVSLYEATSTGLQSCFDVSTGSTVAVSGGSGAQSIQSVGNGWYRCTTTFVAGITGSTALVFMTARATDTGYASYLGDGASGLYLWGFQCEPVTYQTTPSTYVATTSSAYYGPRFDYNPATLQAKGLLLEGSRTNLLTYSEQFDNAAWTPKTNITITSNQIAAPDGNISADACTDDAVNTVHRIGSPSATFNAAAAYTFSVYAKSGTDTFVQLTFSVATHSSGVYANFNLSNGTVSQSGGTGVVSGIQSVGNGWYRCFISAPADLSATTGILIHRINSGTATRAPSYAGSGTTIYIWGAQVEQGSFPTSYIPTVASSVARAAETFAITGYSTNLIEAFYIDEATGGSYSANYNAGTAPSPSYAWLTALRVYTNAYAGDIATPSWIDNTGTTGNRMVTDSTGMLTWAPANLLTYSEQFDNAAWTKTNILAFGSGSVANATTAPDGTVTADKLVENTAASVTHTVTENIASVTIGASYTFTVYAKPAGRSFIALQPYSDGNYAYFNISAGTVGTTAGSGTAKITDAGNGWYRCSITAPSPTTGTITAVVYLANADNSASYTGDGVSGVYLWGAQLERVTYQTAPRAYIPTTTAAIYNPRYDYDASTVPATPRGMLIEESRANAAPYSETFSSSWIFGNSSFSTLAGNTTASPAGVVSAGRLTEDSANARHFIYLNSTTVSTTIYTLSVFAKSGTRNFVALGLRNSAGTTGYVAVFNLNTGAMTATNTIGSPTSTGNSITSAGNGWYRISVTMAANSVGTFMECGLSNSGTPSYSANMPIYTGDGSSFAYLWGMQLEAGSFATSYIPTTTASVTRVADVVKLTGSALTAVTGAQTSVITQASTFGQSGPTPLPTLVNISDGTTGNYIRVNSGTGYGGRLFVQASSVNQVNSTTGAAPTVNQTFRVGVAVSLNNFGVSYNGGNVATDTLGTVPTTNQASVGNWFTSATTYLNGYFQSVAIYNQRLPNAILKQKSTVGAQY